MMSKEFVERINLSLKSRKIPKKKFYEDLHLSNNSSTNWSNRGTVPAADVVLRIADYLGVSYRWLLTGERGIELAPLLQQLVDAAAFLSDEELVYFIGQIKSYKVMDNRKRGGTSPGSSDLQEA